MRFIALTAFIICGCGEQAPRVADPPPVPAASAQVAPKVAIASDSQGFTEGERQGIDRFLRDGSVNALVTLSTSRTLLEMSDYLRGLKAPASVTDATKVEVLAQGILSEYAAARDKGVYYSGPLIEVDTSGRPHIAFIEARVVKEPDRLGNPVSWKHAGFYLHRDQTGAWTRESLPSRCHKLSRLLVESTSKLWLLCVGQNTEVLLAVRDSGKKRWTISEVIWDGNTDLLHGADADFDATGTLHVVWSPWHRDHEQRIFYRTRQNGSWSDVETIPGVMGRNLTEPRLRTLGKNVELVTAGQQVLGQKLISMFQFQRSKGKWSAGRELTPVSSFESYVDSGATTFLVGAQASSDELFVGFSGHAHCYNAPKIAEHRGYSDYADLAAGPQDAAFVLYENIDQLFLARAKGQKAEALLFARGTNAAEIRQPRLAIVDGRLHAVWVRTTGDIPELHYAELSVPSGGWDNLPSVVWGARAGAGLGKPEIIELADLLHQRALDFESQDKVQQALEVYIYVLANIDFYMGKTSTIQRLACLPRSAVVAAIDQYMANHNRANSPGWEQLIELNKKPVATCNEIHNPIHLPQPHR